MSAECEDTRKAALAVSQSWPSMRSASWRWMESHRPDEVRTVGSPKQMERSAKTGLPLLV